MRNQQITPQCSNQSTLEGTVTLSLKFRSYKVELAIYVAWRNGIETLRWFGLL